MLLLLLLLLLPLLLLLLLPLLQVVLSLLSLLLQAASYSSLQVTSSFISEEDDLVGVLTIPVPIQLDEIPVSGWQVAK